MTDINTVVLVGRLTKDLDPTNQREFFYTQSNIAIASISIAANESIKKNGQYDNYANFFDVKIFGKLAENLKPYFVKGQQVAITGHLHQERWTNQQNQQQSRISINADSVQLLGENKNNANTSQNVQENIQNSQPYQNTQNQQQYNQQNNYQQIQQNPNYQQQPSFDNFQGVPF